MKKADIVLVVVVILAAAISLFLGHFLKREGTFATVSVDGSVVAEYALDEDGTYEIKGADGGVNILVIEDGKAFLSEADCPDLLCVKQGSISKVGESIICLPHKVVIEITGEGEKTQIDAVSQ